MSRLRIGIFPNLTKPECGLWIPSFIQLCEKHGVDVVLPSYVLESTQAIYRSIDAAYYQPCDELMPTIDIAFILGGDGTVLKMARSFALAQVPVCAVNFGSLGFLFEVEPTEVEHWLTRILAGDYHIEERMMLSAALCEGENVSKVLPMALNEIVIAHGNVGKMVRIDVYIDGHFVQQYPGDGIIVSTPTGSTGYSFSGGGSIVAPQVKCLMVTPICPHLLLKTPFILDEQAVLTFSSAPSRNSVRISIDGMTDQELPRTVSLRVSRSDYALKMIRFTEKYFYTNLFTKLAGKS